MPLIVLTHRFRSQVSVGRVSYPALRRVRVLKMNHQADPPPVVLRISIDSDRRPRAFFFKVKLVDQTSATITRPQTDIMFTPWIRRTGATLSTVDIQCTYLDAAGSPALGTLSEFRF